MMTQTKRLLRAYKKQSVDRIPFWFMRQAGRYLPEYKALRATTKGFLDFCYTPEKASIATLQPIERFGMDGAIIFSDILVVPHAIGVDVRFEEGHGPLVTPITTRKGLESLSTENLQSFLAPVYEALRLTKKNMPSDVALIGFVGAPWTLACYVVEGKSSKDFATVQQIAKNDPAFFSALIELLTQAVAEHAIHQIEAGAEAIQIFDSWAGILDADSFHTWCIAPTKKIVSHIRKSYPNVPIIGFPRAVGEKYQMYAENVGADAISFDETVSLEWTKQHLQNNVCVQGALNNALLADDKTAMMAQAKNILSTLDKPFVFNLGHGILPHTPIENVKTLCEFLKAS